MMTFTSNFRYLQFYQPMVLNSLVVSLIPVAILSLQVFHVRHGDGEGNGEGDCDSDGNSGSGGDDNAMVVLIDIAMAQDNFLQI